MSLVRLLSPTNVYFTPSYMAGFNSIVKSPKVGSQKTVRSSGCQVNELPPLDDVYVSDTKAGVEALVMRPSAPTVKMGGVDSVP